MTAVICNQSNIEQLSPSKEGERIYLMSVTEEGGGSCR